MPDRYTRWKRASYALSGIEHSLVLTVQWLGRLDIQHLKEDRRYLDLSVQARSTDVEMYRFSDHYTMSYLWVLEAYGVLRTIDRCVRSDRALLPPDIYLMIRSTEEVFAKLQLEPVRKGAASDACIFSPVLNRKFGVGWQVSPAVVLTRRELSDGFLDVLEYIQHYVTFHLKPPKFLKIE